MLECVFAGRRQEDFARRRRLAWAVVCEYSRVWRSAAAFDAKKNLFTALVGPILLHGAFTHPNTREAEETPRHCHARLLRCCVGLGRSDPERAGPKPTEFLYYGKGERMKKTWRSAPLTLRAAIARQ